MQIKIWEDPWIMNEITRRPITPRGHTVLTRVAELLHPDTGSWDEELVRKVFWEEDDHEDALAWHFDNKGQFSVKSAYHVLDDEKNRMKSRQRGLGSNSSCVVNNRSAIWRKLWKLPCQPRVCHFLWRLARNSLAFKMNIQRRGVQLDTRCPVCHWLDEDGGHCFLKCKLVKRCWSTLSLEPVRQQLLSKQSAWEVVTEILSLKGEIRTKTVLFLWKWWTERNKINKGEKGQGVDGVAADVINLLNDLSKLERKEPIRQTAGNARWKAPPPG